MKKCNIGIVGAGTVGIGLLEMIRDQKEAILEKTGLDITVLEIATRTPSKVPKWVEAKVSNDINSIIKNPSIDIVVELIGGSTTALEIVQSALKNGKTFVTANKALISEHGSSLFDLALSHSLEIGYEAAVAGSIPIIRTLRNSLVTNQFSSISGILNGTTNFILTKMEVDQLTYKDALKLAQDLGFAESDPTFDVEGIDVAHKISILANLAFACKTSIEHITIQGITSIQDKDISNALEMGYRIKLIGSAFLKNGKILMSVQPTLVPFNHPLANVMFEKNAVYYTTSHSGAGMLIGSGAGAHPTASSVLADIIYYGKRRGSTPKELLELNQFPAAEYGKFNEEKSRYYLRFTTLDKPGVLAEIAKILGKYNISISSMQQEESLENEPTSVVILTHLAKVGDYTKSIQEIDSLKEIIKEPTISFPLMENM
ncbi:MAG: homoserine dehydrogenase [Leptospira sp.]|jgi:homoserine dehydrogenase|nr:homoserine dehydrogenase [Leptospira sp.]NCS94174.1 homoserine dehydrogenase [Leptospira sp.]